MGIHISNVHVSTAGPGEPSKQLQAQSLTSFLSDPNAHTSCLFFVVVVFFLSFSTYEVTYRALLACKKYNSTYFVLIHA